jgi:hypothetical protein
VSKLAGDAISRHTSQGWRAYSRVQGVSRKAVAVFPPTLDAYLDAERDLYRCPANHELRYCFSSVEAGRPRRYYKTSACRPCPLKAQCTRNKENRHSAGPAHLPGAAAGGALVG